MERYTNFISRDMSLTAIWYPFHVRSTSSARGYDCKNLFYFADKGFIKGYQSHKDDLRVKRKIISFVKKGLLYNYLARFKQLIGKRKELIDDFIKTDLNSLSQQAVIDAYKKFHSFYITYWFHHLFAFYLDGIDDTQYKKYLIDYNKLIKEVRMVNPYLSFDEEYLPHLFDYISKKFSVAAHDLTFLLPSEIIALMEKKESDLAGISLRKRQYLLIKLRGTTNVLAGTEALREYVKRIPDFKDLRISELQGTPAYKGKIRGEVKVVLFKKDLHLIPKGAVIVAPQTTPEFTPKLKDAKAIITDAGGILSHAAIISRELEKPCVIGTKYGSRVLCDGDFVEVDGSLGLIKILRRSRMR